MPTVQQHVAQWKHNRQFAKTIDSKYRDWQINVIFYAALHAIDAALASVGVQVSEHADRNNHVRTNESFARVRTQYLDLYRISRVTRYDADPDRWIPAQYLTVADLVEPLLIPIENGLRELIQKKVNFPQAPLKLQE